MALVRSVLPTTLTLREASDAHGTDSKPKLPTITIAVVVGVHIIAAFL